MKTNSQTLLLGELTLDHNQLPNGTFIGPGGSVFFSAITLGNFDSYTDIITHYGVDFPTNSLPKSRFYPDTPNLSRTLQFDNIYTNSDRIQKVDFYKEIMESGYSRQLQDVGDNYSAVMIAPLIPTLTLEDHKQIEKKFRKSLKVLLPQGLFRKIDKDGNISTNAWSEGNPAVSMYDFIILSEKDATNAADLARHWAKGKTNVIVTRAEKGCTFFSEGIQKEFSAILHNNIEDTTGAGDIFSSAFVFAYTRTKDIGKSIHFSHATASFSLRFHSDKLQYTYSDIIAFAESKGREVRV